MEWGSLADWTAVGAAALAVVYAAGAARDSRALARREADRDEQRAADAEREQAELVTSWVSVVVEAGTGAVTSAGVVIQNASTTPVFDVCVRANDSKGVARAPLRLSVVPPGEFYAAATESAWHWEFPESVTGVGGTLRPVMRKPEWRVDHLAFTDSSSRRWRRDERGTLAPAET